jgi:hypothetical protein
MHEQGALHAMVVWSGWLAVAGAVAVAVLAAASVVGRFTTRNPFHNLQTDAEFFAGCAMVVTLILVVLFLLISTAGFAWTALRPSSEHAFFGKMALRGLMALGVALVGGFLSIKVFRGGILPH